MRVLKMHLFRAGAMRQFVRSDFNDFNFGAGNPSDTTLIQLDQGRDYYCHKTTLLKTSLSIAVACFLPSSQLILHHSSEEGGGADWEEGGGG